jgi:hypothetical protein
MHLVLACTDTPAQIASDATINPSGDTGPAHDSGPGPDEDTGVDAVMDAGVFADAEPKDFGPRPPDATVPEDVGTVDAGPSAEDRCRVHFSPVEEYAEINSLLPVAHRRALQAWMSADYRNLYLTIEMPNDLTPGWFSDDIYVLTRTATSGPFQQGRRLNLDVASLFANESHERGLKYVAGQDRYWYAEGTVVGSSGGARHILMSVRIPDPAHPESFDDFRVEHLNLSEVNQAENIRSPALTPDGLLMIAAKQVPPNRRQDLYEFRRNRVEDPFDEGQALTVNSTVAMDESPWISDDGLQLVFQTNRMQSVDLFCAWRSSISEPFQGPIPFGGPQMSPESSHEMSPFMIDGDVYFIRILWGNGRVQLDKATR